MANFQQATKWIREGERVRRKSWLDEKRRVSMYSGGSKIKINFKGTIQDFEANDWEIYEEEVELKTLKDILNESRFSTEDEPQLDAILTSNLKQEAIKWIKNEASIGEENHISLEVKYWIRRFFNITEEDLK